MYTLETVLVEFIWRVIYFHWQVGNALPYLYDSKFIKWGYDSEPSPTTIWTLATGFATSARQKQLVTMNFNNMSDAFKDLQSNLKKIKADKGKSTVEELASWVWELEPSVAR